MEKLLDSDIEKLQKIYKEEFWRDISENDAGEIASQLLNISRKLLFSKSKPWI